MPYTVTLVAREDLSLTVKDLITGEYVLGNEGDPVQILAGKSADFDVVPDGVGIGRVEIESTLTPTLYLEIPKTMVMLFPPSSLLEELRTYANLKEFAKEVVVMGAAPK